MKNLNSTQKKMTRVRQSGQLIIEAVLIMVLMVGLVTVLRNQFRDRRIIGSLVAGPWGVVAGMMSNGTWRSEREGRRVHPQGNVMTREGDSN